MSLAAPVSTLPLFAQPAPEQAKARNVLARMADERRAWLERMRGALVGIQSVRTLLYGEADPRSWVTADDAQQLAKARGNLALPAGASPNLFGAVFRAPGWVRSAHKDHQSSTDGSHGNDLYRWRYVGQPKGTA